MVVTIPWAAFLGLFRCCVDVAQTQVFSCRFLQRSDPSSRSRTLILAHWRINAWIAVVLSKD